MVQNDKQFCLLHSIFREPYIVWLSFMIHICMVQMCKMIISPGVFLNFQILIFQVVIGLKGQKMAQNYKNFCLLHLIFQEQYIIWSSFMVHMYVWKDNISGNFFHFFFQNFDFQDHKGWRVKRAKNDPKWQKILPVSLCISGTMHHMIVIFGTHL